MKLIIFAVSLLFVYSVEATDRALTFDFNLQSSGADFYACNAGLKHELNKVIYYPRNDTTVSAMTTETTVPYNEMTLEQKGKAACSRWGGVNNFASMMNPIYHGWTWVAGEPVGYKDSDANNYEGLACAYHAILTQIKFKALKEHLGEKKVKNKIHTYVNTAVTKLSVVFDNFTTSSAGATCEDKNKCFLVVADNTEDFLVAARRTWDGNDPYSDLGVEIDMVVAGDDGFTQVSNGVWGAQELIKIDFFLGSNLFGSEYFVDFCYRGNKINYQNFSTEFFAFARAEIMSTGLTTYGDWSDLESKLNLVCNTRQGNVVEYSESSSMAGANYVELLNGSQTLDVGDNVDTCALRFSFTEQAKDKIRPHQLTNQKVHLHANIKEKRRVNN